MRKNNLRIWELLGLAAVLLAAKIFSSRKPKALPGVDESAPHHKSEKEKQGEMI